MTGSFNWGGGGPIRGTVSGATLSGEWEMTSTKGTFRLTLAPDARSFTGTWQGTKGSLKGQSGSWTGSYLGGGTPRSSKVTETYAWSVKGRGSASPPVVSVFGRGRLTVDAKGRIRTASGRLDVTFVRAAGTHDLWRLKTAVPGGFSRKEHAGEVSLVLWLRAEVVDAVGPARIRCAADPVGNVQVFLKAKDSTDVILELRRLCGVPYVGLDGKDRSATLRASIRKVG